MAKRILQVLNGMDRGGIETWLMHVLRHIDRQRFQIDFLVHTKRLCTYDSEIRALGSRITPCAHPHRPLAFARDLRCILRRQGPYDIVHSHHAHLSGYVLRLATMQGVPARIAHSHSDTSRVQEAAPLIRRLYLALMERWISGFATAGLACSRQAAAALFSAAWETDPRYQTLLCGLDWAPFHADVDRSAIRAELGIADRAFVIGHVGRFAPMKNHSFLLEILREVAKRAPESRLLLVGDGPLRTRIEEQAARAGLTDRVIFVGVRPDVAQLMLGAMDLFLFPSRYEGLGLVMVEAQAAGLPCLCSDVIPPEADVVRPLVRRLSLSQPASTWAEHVLAARETWPPVDQREALASVEQSPFSIRRSVQALEAVYGG